MIQAKLFFEVFLDPMHAPAGPGRPAAAGGMFGYNLADALTALDQGAAVQTHTTPGCTMYGAEYGPTKPCNCTVWMSPADDCLDASYLQLEPKDFAIVKFANRFGHSI